MLKKKAMRSRIFFAVLLIGILTMSAAGCGVPKNEHEKIVSELDKANQEKTALSDQISKLKGENESLSQKVMQSENDLNTLRQENEELKAKAAKQAKSTVKKPAPSSKKKKK